MNEANSCKNCGNALQKNDPGALCPSCLMGHAFHKAAENPTTDASGFSYPRAEELVGRFPNLEILHLVGHGGMGAVYLARQTNLDRLVALKVLSPRLDNDPSFTERFIREAKTLAKLSHSNIVAVFDYGQTENLNYLIMEYVNGINLRDAIQEGKLTPKESLAIVQQICDALQFAHDNGVIHRDIKPENVLLDKQGRVKIADFGLAKLVRPDREDFTLTGTQQVLGTRNYMAPEQIEKPEMVDHRADIYSLGVVFYELLTGELPLGRFAAPSEKAAVNKQLDEVVLRSLEKEPARRYQQASEVRSAVESIPEFHAKQASPAEAEPAIKPIVSLPFIIDEVYQGFAAAHGIAHLHADRLELEYEVVDELIGAVKSSTQLVQVPLASLVNVRFIKGYFSDRIEFQADRIEAAKDIPNSKQGRFSLTTKRADIELAKTFVDQIELVRQAAGGTAPPPPFTKPKPGPDEESKPMSPAMSKVIGLGDHPNPGRQEVIEALRIPRIGLVVLGVIHLILGIKDLLRLDNWQKLQPLETSWLPGYEIHFYLPYLDFSNLRDIMMLGLGIMMLAIASRMRRPRNYYFVYIALIGVILAPVHVAYVLTVVFSVWALVILSDSRCRAVYLAEDNKTSIAGYRNPFADLVWVPISVIFAVCGLIALASVGLWAFDTYGDRIESTQESTSGDSDDKTEESDESKSDSNDDSQQKSKSDKASP